MFLDVLIVVLALGVLAGAYAVFAPRRSAAAIEPARPPVAAEGTVPPAPAPAPSEAERVDAVFALRALEGDEATRRLVAALDDPSETVALAAAHALAASGRRPVLDAYAAAHPGQRSARLVETIGWMHEGQER